MRQGRSKASPRGTRRAKPGNPTPTVALPAGLEARDRAFRLVQERATSFPDMTIGQVDESGLSARDAALAHTVADSATRYWLTLIHILELYLKSRIEELEPPMRAVLLGGAAQIVVMDRIPVHAAIDTSVEWAKRAIRPGAAGMVNAVLRRVAELADASSSGERAQRPTWKLGRDEVPLPDGTSRALAGPVLPDPLEERLTIATSHPFWLVRRWIASFGVERASQLAHHSLAVAPTILNVAHARRPLEPSEHLRPHASPGHLIGSGPRAWLGSLLAARNDVWVQDPASSRAIADVAGLSPGVILDLCAGQGTKTRQLAATFPNARVIASDPDTSRSRALREAVAGLPQVTVMTPQEVRQTQAAGADLILLDVPCSNTGVLARRVEAKYRCGPAQLSRLTAIQRQIVADAAPLLSSSGQILYSTCSLDEAENLAIAATAEQFGLRIQRESLTMPAGRPGQDPAEYHDGSYSALLSRLSPK